MSSDPPDGAVVTEDLIRAPSIYRLPGWVYLVAAAVWLACLGVIGAALLGGEGLGTLWMVFPGLLAYTLPLAAGRTVVVDRRGLRHGLRRIPWRDVDHVKQASPWTESVTLVLTSGAERPTGLPKQLATDVARIGQVPCRD